MFQCFTSLFSDTSTAVVTDAMTCLAAVVVLALGIGLIVRYRYVIQPRTSTASL